MATQLSSVPHRVCINNDIVYCKVYYNNKINYDNNIILLYNDINNILLYAMHDVCCEANAQLRVLHVINNYYSGLLVVQTHAYT